MKLVKAEDLFTEAKELLEGRTADGEPREKDIPKAEIILNEILDNNIGNEMVLYVLGSLYAEAGKSGLAIQLLSQVVASMPSFGEAWNNLSLAFRAVNKWDQGLQAAKQAAKFSPHPDIICNVAALQLGRNRSEEALKYADKALAIDPDHLKAGWHKAIALLEMRQWSEGWKWHEKRFSQGAANYDIATRNYHGDERTPQWDGKSPGTVVIHGEQGMGDEIMFASCIPDAIASGAKIILEPSPRLEKLFARSFPGAYKVFGTDGVDGTGWIEEEGKPDFMCGMGSLPMFYRNSDEAFPGTPYIKADPELAAWWGGKLKALGNKPKIGLAWQGGVGSTRQDARSFHPGILGEFLQAHDVDWISLQYDITARDNVKDIKDKYGVTIHHWPKAVEAVTEDGKPSNIDELAALTSKLDLVISVCQTAVHVAGALGVPTWCLTPAEPSWRYGSGDKTDMPWYGSVYQFRQESMGDWATRTSNSPVESPWAPVVHKVHDRMGRFLLQRKYA